MVNKCRIALSQEGIDAAANATRTIPPRYESVLVVEIGLNKELNHGAAKMFNRFNSVGASEVPLSLKEPVECLSTALLSIFARSVPSSSRECVPTETNAAMTT